jgi:TonB family protein
MFIWPVILSSAIFAILSIPVPIQTKQPKVRFNEELNLALTCYFNDSIRIVVDETKFFADRLNQAPDTVLKVAKVGGEPAAILEARLKVLRGARLNETTGNYEPMKFGAYLIDVRARVTNKTDKTITNLRLGFFDAQNQREVTSLSVPVKIVAGGIETVGQQFQGRLMVIAAPTPAERLLIKVSGVQFEDKSTWGVTSPAEFNEVDTRPILLNVPQVDYPEMRNNRVAGEVLVYSLIGEDGTYKQTWVIQSLGNKIDELALQAASGAKYKPAMKAGKAVPYWVLISVDFKPR